MLHYDRALWNACEQMANNGKSGCQIWLEAHAVSSLNALEAKDGPWDAIIVAGGAAVGLLPEIGTSCYMLCICYSLVHT